MDHSALTWRKSTYSSNPTSGDCVELACLPLTTAVRDSKNPDPEILSIPADAWSMFLAELR